MYRGSPWNLYEYAESNPLLNTDPQGLGNGWTDVGEGIFTALGYVVTGSEIPGAALAAPDIAKILIAKKFSEACKDCLMNPPKSDRTCKICSEYELVKKVLQPEKKRPEEGNFQCSQDAR